MKLNKIILSFISALALLLSTSVTSFAKVVGDKIILGSAISLTGKYSSNGVHTQNGYNMACLPPIKAVDSAAPSTAVFLTASMM